MQTFPFFSSSPHPTPHWSAPPTPVLASQVALVVKNPPANSGHMRDAVSILGSGRSPGGGHGNPLQYSGLENPMDRGAWRLQSTGLQRVRLTEETEHTHLSSSWKNGLHFPLHSQANSPERQYREWARTGTLDPKSLSLSSCSLHYKSYNLSNHYLTQFPNLLLEIIIMLIHRLRIKDIC